jgi:asparagine synthase (glutamine-hydrolysing)
MPEIHLVGQTLSDSTSVGVAARRRTRGRIAGIIGLENPDAAERLIATNVDGCQLLGPGLETCVADFDACWLDSRALNANDWHALCLEHKLGSISGAFAAAWREPDGTICLARDQIGERSLFYARVGQGLIFASDLRALLAGGLVEPVINRTAVARYLSYGYVPGRETLLSGVHKVLPGEMVRFRDGELSSTLFWSLPPEADESVELDEGELREQLRATLESAVRRRLPRDGPVGAFLSGGIDSSLVVALARRFHRDDVLTYSVSFGAGYRNELPFSSLVAEHCGTRHHVVEITPQAILQYLDGCLAALGDPIGDPLTVPNALLFREAAREVDVVLNGEGGDPCFGGPKNLPMLLAELLGDGLESDDVASRPIGRARSYLRAHQKCYDDLPKMLRPEVIVDLCGATLEREIAPFFTDPRWTRFVARLMAINVSLKGPYHILHKVDAVSAPFGVVARSPLFDRTIVELAFAIPPQLKLRGSVEKYLLKEAVRDLLPAAIVDRPKSGMLVPVEAWFRGPLLAEARERLMDGLTSYGLFNGPYLEGLLDGRLAGLHPRRGTKIWMLVTLESWLRSVAARG